MVCDRASDATMFMVLSTIYKDYSLFFFLCFVIDLGSHWLQFQSTALMKSESHKGKNKKENWLVQLYYDNYPFFCWQVVGAEGATITLFWAAKSDFIWNNLFMTYMLYFLVFTLCTKMVINLFQWFGAIQRIEEWDAEQLKNAEKSKK